jgi:hypothetical protein
MSALGGHSHEITAESVERFKAQIAELEEIAANDGTKGP